MAGIWAKGLSNEQNCNIAFFKYFNKAESGVLSIAGGSCFQVFADGKLIFFGPFRAAHGFSRISKIAFCAKNLVVIAAGYNIRTFWLVNEHPFLHINVTLDSNINFTELDFNVALLTDRIKKVQRYSYQRAYIESYRCSGLREKLLNGKCLYPLLDTEPSKNINKLIESNSSLPLLEEFANPTFIECGNVKINQSLKPWRDRAHYNEYYTKTTKEVYDISDWEDAATDEVSKFEYFLDVDISKHCNANSKNNVYGKYNVYDFSRAITGFLQLKIKVNNSAKIYVIYDELIWDEESDIKKPTKNISFYRNTCSNVFKFEFSQSGEYLPITLEPYTMRYVKVVIIGDAQLDLIKIFDYSNPDVKRFKFETSDVETSKIIAAAVDTLAQNAVDLLTDCPSRERAGWLSDSYFSSEAECLFTGENKAEQCFLENYAMAQQESNIPDGMVSMCYPADNYDKMFIPNWSMWYILEINKHFLRFGQTDITRNAQPKIEGIIKYFDSFTNELGLLENLESWVFVEWSEANDANHIVGVNTASNICWASCLMAAGKMLGNESLVKRGALVEQKILELSFDGQLFVDNLIRRDGKLISSGLFTEVCQYYAFWFNAATPQKYPQLYDFLMNKLGVNRQKDFRNDIGKPNAMYGIYMRLDLLEREGKQQLLYNECKQYFYKMALRTGTLWEHNNINASTVHGFAAYAAKWIIYALTGYLGGKFYDNYLAIDCKFTLPQPNGNITVVVKNGKRTITNK